MPPEERPVRPPAATAPRRLLGALGAAAMVLAAAAGPAFAEVASTVTATVEPACGDGRGAVVVSFTAGAEPTDVDVLLDGQDTDSFVLTADETRSYEVADGLHEVVVSTPTGLLAAASPTVDCVAEPIELAIVPACEPEPGVGVTGLSRDQGPRTVGVGVAGTVTTLEVPAGDSSSIHVPTPEGVHTVTLTDGDEPPFIIDVEVACDTPTTITRDDEDDDGTTVLGNQVTATPDDDEIPNAGPVADLVLLAVAGLLLLLSGTELLRRHPA